MKRSRLDVGQKSRERGSTFEKPRSELRRNGGSRKVAPISEASRVQRRKVIELRFCIACGVELSEYVAIDPAHLAPRVHGGCDSGLCVVPLCRRASGWGCHRDFDEGRLDLLSIIVARWPAEMPELQHALEHLLPVQLLERLGAARVEWRAQAA